MKNKIFTYIETPSYWVVKEDVSILEENNLRVEYVEKPNDYVKITSISTNKKFSIKNLINISNTFSIEIEQGSLFLSPLDNG